MVVVIEDRMFSSTNISFNLARPELITNSQRNDLFTVESFEFKVSWRANTSPTNHITRITRLWRKGILFSSRLIIDKKWLHLLNLYPCMYNTKGIWNCSTIFWNTVLGNVWKLTVSVVNKCVILIQLGHVIYHAALHVICRHTMIALRFGVTQVSCLDLKWTCQIKNTFSA